MTPSEAFAAVALVAVGCDSSLSREEAKALRVQLEGRSPYRTMSEQEMGDLFDQLLQRLRQEGWQQLLASALAVLTEPQQETALAMAVHLIHSDQVLADVERSVLQEMATQLKLPQERCQIIIDVIGVLNRDSLAS